MMYQRIAGALGALSLVLAIPAFAAFSDVSSTHPYADSIAYVQAEGIVSGNPDGTYKPNASINRAEFTKIVINATTSTSIQCPPVMPFIDVASNAWYTPFVCEAKSRNVIGGYQDGTFRPSANINFAEAAKILVGAFALPVESGGEWWQPYTAVLESKNALPSSYTSPDRFVTRGEMAFMIHRIKVPAGNNGCKVAGCSGQLCVEEGDDGISTCEWRDEYACYQTATCERQDDGECGWTDTPELRACLTGEPTNPCAAVLCPINTQCRDGQCIPLSSSSRSATTSSISASPGTYSWCESTGICKMSCDSGSHASGCIDVPKTCCDAPGGCGPSCPRP